MDVTDRWEEANERYLSAALAWLRLRLLRLAGGGHEGEKAKSDADETGFALWRRRGEGKPAERPPASRPARVKEADLEKAAARLAEAADADPPPALRILAQRFGLSELEQEVLLLATSMELDTRIPALCAHAQDDPNRPYPTFALALALFDAPAWDVLSPERPLRYWRLVEVHQIPAQPLVTSPLRADERIVHFLKGLNEPDERLLPLLAPLTATAPGELAASQQHVVELGTRALERAAANGERPAVQLLGTDEGSKKLVAAHVAARLGLAAFRLPVELLPRPADELETFTRLWQRECLLLPLALYLDVRNDEGTAEGGVTALQRFLTRSQGEALFVASREALPELAGSTILDVGKPTAAEQRSLWKAALGPRAASLAARLAGQFDVGPAAVSEIAGTLEPNLGPEELASGVWRACRVRTRPQMENLAVRLPGRATWKDIVLTPQQVSLLRQLQAQVAQRSRVYDDWGFRRKMSRGFGITALFAGPSGTGKTMAAEVLANELELDLYRIDLSAVVSKYIGETEKNLRRLFDAAEDGGAILFFDEADALFGRRSEVKDSHDRYANIEVNYLLQRMEAYRGLAILATNMKSALDPAFVRRLRFIVQFPAPKMPERKRIWSKVFPPEMTPEHVEALDIHWLAQLDLTGGSIHSIALNAAFLAAADSGQVTMPLLVTAIRDEMRKLERSYSEADLRWQAPQKEGT